MVGRTRGGRAKVVRPHGQLRRSQLVGGSGPGALLDLPRHAVIVGGLEDWGSPEFGKFERVDDERTRARLANKLQIPGLQLFSPPVEGDTFGETLAPGATVWAFPRWFIAQKELTPGVRPLVHALRLVDGKYLDDERKKHSVVPVRFVRACANGHIDDIDWVRFAHRGTKTCKQQLLWKERGASGDFVDIFVACQCGEFPDRSIIEATKKEEPVLGMCFGPRPWLGRVPAEGCTSEDDKEVPFRLLVRNASNAYFSLMDRTITIPEPNQTLRMAVGKVWKDHLDRVEKVDELAYERRSPVVQVALADFKDSDIFAEIQRRRTNAPADERTAKVAEVQTFMAVRGQEGENTPESLFFAREEPLEDPRPAILRPIQKLLLIDRLREVSVQVGFTRFDAPSTDIEGEFDLTVKPGAMAREVSWLPAVENRGEGLFLAFDPAVLHAWRQKPAVERRRKQLEAGFAAWATPRKSKKVPPTIEHVMLHSLSHLLMTALSVKCGYSASSIRERIYALEKDGYGILLHTGTPDAEGTLGGLVHAGLDLRGLLASALDLGAFCSNDPVCAQHHPDNPHEERFLHGAACHGCLLIPETSCELRNDFLDRALVVDTVEQLGCELFEGV